MTSLDDFVKYQKDVEQTAGAANLANSEDAAQRQAYRNAAADLASEYSDGVGQINETTPQAAVDRVYLAALQAKDKIAKSHFKENRGAIISNLPDDKLANVALQIDHPKDKEKGTERNAVIEAIENYRLIKETNANFGKEVDGRRIDEDYLAGIAVPYVQQKVVETLTSKSKPENRYLTKKEIGAVSDALAVTVGSTRGAALAATSIMEKDLKSRYEASLPGDASKAAFARESLSRMKEDQARGIAYRIAA